MRDRISFAALVVGLTLFGLNSGCNRGTPAIAPSEATAVPVSNPVEREVTDYVDFTGQTDAVKSVNVVPRVNGYLTSTPFKEGAEVRGPHDGKEGDLLFEIDSRPYQAQYDQAESQVYLNQARVKQAKADNARAKVLAKTPGAISAQDLDRNQAAEEEAEASLNASIASLEVFKLNLSYCRVTSPIDGQVSRYYLTPGNLVNQDQTLLTTVVSLDPMYVYFDMDESTLLRIRRAVNDGKLKVSEDGVLPVYVGLQGEEGFQHQGKIDFVNNQITAGTGSIKMRGVVENGKPPGGTRLLSPGMFVRVRFPIGLPYPALLVIDRALGNDQGLKYVYIVGQDNKIQYRRVETGPLQPDGLRVITSGLSRDDRVVVGGIQQVRPKMTVVPDPVPMPTFGPTTVGDASPAAGKGSATPAAGDKSVTKPVEGNGPSLPSGNSGR